MRTVKPLLQSVSGSGGYLVMPRMTSVGFETLRLFDVALRDHGSERQWAAVLVDLSSVTTTAASNKFNVVVSKDNAAGCVSLAGT